MRSRVLDAVPERLAVLEPMAEGLISEAHARLDADAIPAHEHHIGLAADMRYKGQAFELTVPARLVAA